MNKTRHMILLATLINASLACSLTADLDDATTSSAGEVIQIGE